jgi:Tol biopolymer transport system component/DNA-binding winged helix-turn-helix (wHTH) protein
MGMPVNTPRIWRFGVFELDALSGELRRNGTVVKLREQPARILLLLLEHAGQMVTREQLRQHLWPSDTFVDFDHSLNSAVMKLREALGDSADKPLYIETIPKKGYRFVAPISQPGDTQNGGASSRLTARSELAVSDTWEQSNGSLEVRTITPDEKKQDRRRLRSMKLALLIVCVVSAIGIAALIRSASLRSALQPKPSSGEPNMRSSNLSSSVLTSAPGDANSPSFSPDGRQIAFVWNGVERTHYDIYVQLVGGDTPLQLTRHKRGDGVPGPPQWSPDGREIAFARCNSERDGVYTVPALGGPERRLTNSPCRNNVAGRPIWTPDSKAMVMLDQCTPGGPRAVVLFSFATGEKRCLATGSHGDFAADDALSPDGRTVAFYRFTDAGYCELYAVPLTGGSPRLVSEGTTFWNPMWTPDGKYIVLYSLRGHMMRPWRVPVSGGPLEPEMVYPGVGSISQDGRKLVYAESQGGASSHFAPAAIWRADLSNAGGPVLRTRKLIYSQFMEDAAQPSPDGTRLALQSGRSGTNQIWLNSTDGDHPVQLTNIGWHSGTPRWSPDGRWIAFDARAEDHVPIHSHIYVVDEEGRNLHAITHGDSDNYVPSWSRDGRSIYFASPRTGSRQIWKHSVEDGSERQLTEHGGFAPLESYDGQTIYYSKFDEPGIWSMPATGGSESPVVAGKPQVSYFGHWAVTESGLYLLDADAEPRPTIEFYSFATRRITPVLSLEKSPNDWQPSLSASRDGRTLFYTQSDPQSVIRMVENFR